MRSETREVVRTMLGVCCLTLVTFVFAGFAPVPKDAVKALKVTKGKPCRAGVVFVDGKYIAPPYVVKRQGTVITINDVQATSPIVAWDRFLATQAGVSVTRTTVGGEGAAGEAASVQQEEAANVRQEEPKSVETTTATAEEDDPLADLFDDEPKEKPKAAKPKPKLVAKPKPKPVVTETYTLTGDFVMNDASKALLDKIERYRNDVNARLVKGGFVFFSSSYAHVSGQSREANRLLSVLPGLMRSANGARELYDAARRNGLVYVTEAIANDLYRNKYMYPQIEERARKLAEEAKFEKLLNGE